VAVCAPFPKGTPVYRNEPETLAVLGRVPTLAERIDADPATDLSTWRSEVDGKDNRSEQVLELSREQTRALVAAHNAEETAALLTAVRSDAAARILGRIDPDVAADALSPLSLSIASWILRAMDERSAPIP